jgi:hypothetical protein
MNYVALMGALVDGKKRHSLPKKTLLRNDVLLWGEATSNRIVDKIIFIYYYIYSVFKYIRPILRTGAMRTVLMCDWPNDGIESRRTHENQSRIQTAAEWNQYE